VYYAFSVKEVSENISLYERVFSKILPKTSKTITSTDECIKCGICPESAIIYNGKKISGNKRETINCLNLSK
jgi:hypothetical protein